MMLVAKHWPIAAKNAVIGFEPQPTAKYIHVFAIAIRLLL
jgi:hypothetical protein